MSVTSENRPGGARVDEASGTTASPPVMSSPLSSQSAWELPVPPTDEEKYWYMGRQHRWIFPFKTLAFALVCVSLTLFSISTPWLYPFLLLMALYITANVVSLLTSFRRGTITRSQHEMRVLTWLPPDGVRFPSVDVFLPSAGEPLHVLRNTYNHVSRLDWPGLITVVVLDDSARDSVKKLADEYDFIYLSRADRGRLKKAGNLKFGFDSTDGDYIAVFDADFVPRPDYLYDLMPYFDEADVAIVQSPQFFDSAKDMHWLQRTAGVTQELFYRWIQPSRDRFNAAICVGTCAVYRRSALDKSGGFAQIGHSEDVHTGVNLMKVGYRVRYVPVSVSKGLCPDTAAAFLNQQYRWCTGSVSLCRDPMYRKHPAISRRQRLCFWAGFLYYGTTALNALLAPIPVIVMLWFLPEWVKPINSVWLIGAVVLWFIVLPAVHRGRWRVDVLRVQTMYSFAHLLAIVDSVRGSTKGWVATGAASKATPISAQVLFVMTLHTALTQSFIWAGLVVGTMSYGFDDYWAMWLLALIGSYVMLPLLLVEYAGRGKLLFPSALRYKPSPATAS